MEILGLSKRVIKGIEEIEARAWSSFYHAASAKKKDELGIHTHANDFGYTTLAAKIDELADNRSIAISRSPDRADLERIIEQFQTAGSARGFIQIRPQLLTAGSNRILADFGLSQYNNWVKLIRDTSDVPDVLTDLQIRQIDTSGKTDFAAILVEAFNWPAYMQEWLACPVGKPNWHHYMVFDGENRVATGAAYIEGESCL